MKLRSMLYVFTHRRQIRNVSGLGPIEFINAVNADLRKRRERARLVVEGFTCSFEMSGFYCGPLSHHPLCYYARHPKGMAPPSMKECANET